MNHIIMIAFQLNGATGYYGPFFAAIGRSQYTWKHLNNTWFVWGPKNALQWQNDLLPLILKGDQLLIMDVDVRAVQGFLVKPAFDWFSKIQRPR